LPTIYHATYEKIVILEEDVTRDMVICELAKYHRDNIIFVHAIL